jgi:hypothetical protein
MQPSLPPPSAAMPLDTLHEGWAEALGQVLREERREWQRERELTAAEHRRIVAELEAQLATIKLELFQLVAAKLAEVKNGEPGEKGAKGEPGEPGPKGEQGERGESAPGSPGEPGELGPSGEPGKDGVDGKDGASGPPGAFSEPREWTEGSVTYECELVTHEGSTWYARRDTASGPPGPDWLLVAAAGAPGRDAPAGEVCGLYDPKREYHRLDLVSFHGSEWRAKRDKPGALPGDGWALAGQAGSRGKQGERGEKGPPGAAGPTIVDWAIEEYRAAPIMSDGSIGPVLDVRTFFELYHGESR